MKKVQVLHYEILEEAPLSNLHQFRKHRKLKVFFRKGTSCASCERVGTRLIKGKGKGCTPSWGVYTDDLYPMTLDHIKPKSLGGSNHVSNLQPMCFGCNQDKGNGVVALKKEVKEKRTKAEVPPHMTCALDFHETEGEIVGKTLWRRSGKSRTMKPVGEVTFIETNPHTGLISAKFAGNERTFHRLSSLYLRVIS